MAFSYEDTPFFDEVAQAWFREHIRALAERSRVHHETVLRLGGMAYFAGVRMSQITPEVADATLDDIEQARGPAARNHARAQLRMIFRWARRRGYWLGPDPFAGSRKAATLNRREPLRPDQASEVVAICRHAMARRVPGGLVHEIHAGYFLLLVYTGLRMREGTTLRLRDYDRRARVLRIARHKTAGKAGEKVIELGDRAVHLLDDIVGRCWSPEWFFPSKRSASGHIADPWRAWDRLRKAVGCEGVRIHDIRHGFAEALYEAGVELPTIAALLGHRSIVTTQRYVGRPRPERLKAAADKAAELIDRKGGDQ